MWMAGSGSWLAWRRLKVTCVLDSITTGSKIGNLRISWTSEGCLCGLRAGRSTQTLRWATSGVVEHLKELVRGFCGAREWHRSATFVWPWLVRRHLQGNCICQDRQVRYILANTFYRCSSRPTFSTDVRHRQWHRSTPSSIIHPRLWATVLDSDWLNISVWICNCNKCK